MLAKIYAKKRTLKCKRRRRFFNGRTALEMLQTPKRAREELKVHCLHKNTAILDVQYDCACKQRVNRQNLHKNLNKKRVVWCVCERACDECHGIKIKKN